MGSASPRMAAPMASTASSGEPPLKEDRSPAREVIWVEKSARASPVRPAALPKVPNVLAASMTWALVMPMEDAAVDAWAVILSMESPKTTSAAPVASSRSEKELTISTTEPLTADTAPVTAEAVRDARPPAMPPTRPAENRLPPVLPAASILPATALTAGPTLEVSGMMLT